MEMYERRSKPILSRAAFSWRLLKHGFISFALVLISLGIGIIGYREFESQSWFFVLRWQLQQVCIRPRRMIRENLFFTNHR